MVQVAKNNDLTPRRLDDEGRDEQALRPQTLEDFVGQHGLRENLRVFVKAAKSRQDALDHVLFLWPSGTW